MSKKRDWSKEIAEAKKEFEKAFEKYVDLQYRKVLSEATKRGLTKARAKKIKKQNDNEKQKTNRQN